MKIKILCLFAGVIAIATNAHSQSYSEVSGRWSGTLTKTYDDCGFDDTKYKVKHKVNAGKYGVTLYTETGLGLVSSAAKNRSFYAVNYYYVGNMRIDVGVKYTNIKNEKAKAELVTFFSPIKGRSCGTVFSGTVRK